MKRVGVAFFDNPKNPEAGWASADGSDAQRIRGVGELDSASLWVCNIEFRDYRKLNLMQAPHIFDQQFFRTSVRQLSDELGLSEDPEEACKVLSRTLTRLVVMGESLLDIRLDRPGYRYASMVADAWLPPHAKKRPSGDASGDLEVAFEQATQENQAMVGLRPSYGSRHHVFNFPRGAYAKWLLGQRLPGSGAWSELEDMADDTIIGKSGGQVVRGTRGVLDRLAQIGEKSAVIMRVKVLSTEPFYQSFATFGVGASTARAWATLPEIFCMSGYSKIVLSGGYRVPYGPLGLEERLSLDADEYAFSRALLYENVWTGLSMPIHATRYRTPIGAFLRAYDRVACFKAAEQFAAHNMTIGSYGTGRVIVYMRGAERETANGIARSVGLLPPLI